jgi:hypothetical protein
MRLSYGIALFAIILPATGWSQSQQDQDYVDGFHAWRDAQYADASMYLSRYRTTRPYGKTYEVDYWLGTSWCRLSGKEPAGASLLDWAYRYQSMPESERPKFLDERDLCLQGQHPAPRLIQIATVPRATGRAQAKIFYLAGQRDGSGLNAPPLRVTKPLPPAEYASRVFPQAKLAEAKAATAQRLPNAKIYADGRFVLASLSPQHSMHDLETVAKRLGHFLQYLDHEYGIQMPDAVVTVYLVPDSSALVKLATTLHGISAHPATLGYAFQNDLSVVCVLTGTAAGTVLHELFHLAVRSGFGDIPQFLDEGMAALYETSIIEGDRYFGAPNWRGKVLRAAREQHLTVPLEAVVTSPWFSDEPVAGRLPGLPTLDWEQQAYVLSASRYFLIWMQQQGLLPALFKAMRDRPIPTEFVPADKQAIQILEGVTKHPMSAIERGFQTWLQSAERLDSGQRFPVAKKGGEQGKTTTKELPAEFVDREMAPANGRGGR